MGIHVRPVAGLERTAVGITLGFWCLWRIIRGAMDESTAIQLIKAIGEALKSAAEANLKLAALERALEQQRNPLFESWRKEIGTLRKQRAYELNLEALNSLIAKLRHQ